MAEEREVPGRRAAGDAGETADAAGGAGDSAEASEGAAEGGAAGAPDEVGADGGADVRGADGRADVPGGDGSDDSDDSADAGGRPDGPDGSLTTPQLIPIVEPPESRALGSRAPKSRAAGSRTAESSASDFAAPKSPAADTPDAGAPAAAGDGEPTVPATAATAATEGQGAPDGADSGGPGSGRANSSNGGSGNSGNGKSAYRHSGGGADSPSDSAHTNPGNGHSGYPGPGYGNSGNPGYGNSGYDGSGNPGSGNSGNSGNPGYGNSGYGGSGYSTPSGGTPSAASGGVDDQTSEFAVPEGLELTPAEPAEPSSEFTVPEGLVAPQPTEQHSEFRYGNDPRTPVYGTPALLLRKGLPWHDRMRSMVRMPLSERPAPEPVRPVEDEEEPQLAVPRVLDLTLRIGELLLASGEGAEDVETAMFAIAHAYGLDRCEATVTFTLIEITHQPSLVDAPIALSRTVRRRGTDYTRLASVFRLVDDISKGSVSLEEAYGTLATIRRNRHPFTKWQLSCAAGLLAGSASVLVGGGPLVFVLAMSGAILGDRLAWLLASRGLPEFYQFVAAAMAPAAMGVLLAAVQPEREGLIRAAAVITGGLFALIPGRALVASVQDGLTGYYITASARLLEVLYLIAGLVLGVLGVIYVAETSGVQLNPETVDPQIRPVIQLLAAMALALAFCVMLQQEKATVLAATLNGGVAWLIFGAMRDTAGLSGFASTLVAAGMVGLFGQLLARYQHTSALPYLTASIGPLLPGSAVYFGLLGLAQGDLLNGGQHLLRAASLALAIAIGVNLGNEIARLFIGTPGTASPLGRRGAKRTRGF